MWLWPDAICCAALTMACEPVPQARVTPSAALSSGSPAVSATLRLMNSPSASTGAVLPNTRWSTCAGCSPARATAACTTCTPSVASGTSRRLLPKSPKGVRTPLLRMMSVSGLLISHPGLGGGLTTIARRTPFAKQSSASSAPVKPHE